MNRHQLVLLVFIGLAASFAAGCGTTKAPQQSVPATDTVQLTAKDREIFIVSVCDAVPYFPNAYDAVVGATVTLVETGQTGAYPEKDSLMAVFYNVPDRFTLRATHPDYEPGEVTVDLKRLKQYRPDIIRHHGTSIYLKKKKVKK